MSSNKMNNLQLTLHKEWFDAIAAGKKKEEYRENESYWRSRFIGKSYDEVHFRNGYGHDKPFMRENVLTSNLIELRTALSSSSVKFLK